eukprot:Gregarina_sp_Poly_1__7377@NODE_407_length_8828_cov_117_859034_g331_i0_p1_GENE_NODE_407_length_8828_cov_117_859034_g331_i0NODE_407_length_8828_cov_117_859034_g331_i0_p1_ORF_typecomplete_len1478_score205_81TOM20_plant/PF06552_12/0_34DUF678/PF05077_12/0_48TPR_16/PF13432_6/0_78_NODE_407_length_8828_cov_117_859034_g331_i026277060
MDDFDDEFQVQSAHKFVRETRKNLGSASLSGIKFFPLYSSHIWSPKPHEDQILLGYTPAHKHLLDGYQDVNFESPSVIEGQNEATPLLPLPCMGKIRAAESRAETNIISSVQTFAKLLRLPCVNDTVSLVVHRSSENQLIVEEPNFLRQDDAPQRSDKLLQHLSRSEAESFPSQVIDGLESDGKFDFSNKRLSSEHHASTRHSTTASSSLKRTISKDVIEKWVPHVESILQKLIIQEKNYGQNAPIPLPSSEQWEHSTASWSAIDKRVLFLIRQALNDRCRQQQVLQSNFGRYRLCLLNDVPCFALNELIHGGPNVNFNCALQTIDYLAESGGRPDAVDIWLEALLSHSSHVAVCYTNSADRRPTKVIESRVLLDEAAALGLAAPPRQLLEKQMATSLQLLEFLHANCSESRRYWLYKGEDSGNAILIDLAEHGAGDVHSDPLSIERQKHGNELNKLSPTIVTGASLCFKLAIRSRRARMLSSGAKIMDLLAAENNLISRGLQLLADVPPDPQVAALKSIILAFKVQLNLDEIKLLASVESCDEKSDVSFSDTNKLSDMNNRISKPKVDAKNSSRSKLKCHAGAEISSSSAASLSSCSSHLITVDDVEKMAFLAHDSMVILKELCDSTNPQVSMHWCFGCQAQVDAVCCGMGERLRQGPLLHFLKPSVRKLLMNVDDGYKNQSSLDRKQADEIENVLDSVTSVLQLLLISRTSDFARCYGSLMAMTMMKHDRISSTMGLLDVECDSEGVPPSCSRLAIISNFLKQAIHLGLFVHGVCALPFGRLRIGDCVEAIANPLYIGDYLEKLLVCEEPEESPQDLVMKRDSAKQLGTIFKTLHPSHQDEGMSYSVKALQSVDRWDDVWRMALPEIWIELFNTKLESNAPTDPMAGNVIDSEGQQGTFIEHVLSQLTGLLCEWSNNELLQEAGWRTHRASRLTLCLSRLVIALTFSLYTLETACITAVLLNLSRVLQLLSTQYKISFSSKSQLTQLFTQGQYDAYRAAMVCTLLALSISRKPQSKEDYFPDDHIDFKDNFSLINTNYATNNIGCSPLSAPLEEAPEQTPIPEVLGFIVKRFPIHHKSVATSVPYRSQLKLAYHTLAAGVDLVQYLPYQSNLFPNDQASLCVDVPGTVNLVAQTVPFWDQVVKWKKLLFERIDNFATTSSADKNFPGAKKFYSPLSSFLSKLFLPCFLMHLTRDLDASTHGIRADDLPPAILCLLSVAKLHEIPFRALASFSIDLQDKDTCLMKLAVRHLSAAITLFAGLSNTKEKAVAHYYLGRVYHHQALEEDLSNNPDRELSRNMRWNSAAKHFQTAIDEFNPWENTVDFINSVSRMLELILTRSTDLRSGVALGIAGEAVLIVGQKRGKAKWPDSQEVPVFLTNADGGTYSGVCQIRPWLQKLVVALLKACGNSNIQPASKKAKKTPPTRNYRISDTHSLPDLEKYCRRQLSQMTVADIKHLGLVLLKNENPFKLMRIADY